MNRTRQFATRAALLVLAAGLTGCTTYYRISAPDSEEIYYAKAGDVKARSSGAIRFTDEKTGQIITLTNSKMEEINKREFRSATGTR